MKRHHKSVDLGVLKPDINNMGKLFDLQEWMTGAIHGNGKRARSLVQVARKNGVFPTGGRGTGSPDMGSSEGTNGLILVLDDSPPTKCVGVIEEIAELVPYEVEIAPRGPREPERLLLHGADISDRKFPLPAQFPEPPIDARSAIEMVLSAPTRPYFLDEVSLSRDGAGASVWVTVHDLDKDTGSELASERDFAVWKFTFRPPGYDPGAARTGTQTVTSLGGEQLDQLYCLIHGLDPNSDAERGEEGDAAGIGAASP